MKNFVTMFAGLGSLLFGSLSFGQTAPLEMSSTTDTHAALLADANLRTNKDQTTMMIGGWIQFQYAYGNIKNGDEYGFQVQNARLEESGKLNEVVDYKLSELFNNTGSLKLENAWVGVEMDFAKMTAGQFRPKFFYELNTDSSEKMTVNRGVIANTLGQTYTQGVQLAKNSEDWKLSASFTDGNGYANTMVSPANDNYGLFARADWCAINSFKSDSYLSLGGGVNFSEDYNQFTVDTTWKQNNFDTTLAYIYQDASSDSVNGSQYMGIVGQAEYAITDKLTPYVKQEWGDSDVGDNLSISYVGLSYYPFTNKNFKWSNELGYAWGTLNNSWNYTNTSFVPGQDNEVVLTSSINIIF